MGSYGYQLNKELRDELNELLSIINFDSLKSDYFGIMHGPTYKTQIYLNGSILYKINDHSGSVPCEVLWLYNYFSKLSILPFKQKLLENNILGNKNIRIRSISSHNKKQRLIDVSGNDYILSELLNTVAISTNFIPKYYLEVYDLIWDNKSQVMIEKNAGIIESDGLYFKFNSIVYKCKSENLGELFDAIINENE